MPNWNLIHQAIFRYSLESKYEDDTAYHVCLTSKLLVTQTNAKLNSLFYKISATYYNFIKETILVEMYMMNINVKSPN